jgi:hypothetical protein
MFTPAISPADPNLMMLNCDMSAAYISEDGGRNWRMIGHAQLRSDTDCRTAPQQQQSHAGEHASGPVPRLFDESGVGFPRACRGRTFKVSPAPRTRQGSSSCFTAPSAARTR